MSPRTMTRWILVLALAAGVLVSAASPRVVSAEIPDVHAYVFPKPHFHKPPTVRQLAAVRRRRATVVWPAHTHLWLCIHGDQRYRDAPGGEAASWFDHDSGHTGHFGGLQMHPHWGYGTSYYADQDSPLTQMRAAENGYRASGYSRAWLEGQWGQTIGPCWQYAD